VRPYQGALCGSFAGGIAAAATTPLDVMKTRLMLGKDINGVPYTGMLDTGRRIWATEGPMTLFSGIQPRGMCPLQCDQ
jgi:solute carrier family 25 S-adenosylmethionine transporter 26